MIVAFALPLLATDFSDPPQAFIASMSICRAMGVLPDFGPFSGWNRCFCPVTAERVIALPLVVGAVGADLLNFARNPIDQIRQGFSVTEIIGAGNGTDDFERRFVHAEMELTPCPPFTDAVLSDFPFPFAVNLDACRVHNEMARLR